VRLSSIAFLAVIGLAAGVPYRVATPGYRFEFPRDHFNHPDFRTEWWYYTGNLHAENGRRYGFELVFFRQGERRGPADNPSAWRVDDLYLAHLALTDIDAKRFRYYTRLNRAGPGIAGVSLEKSRIWNGNWESLWNLRSGAQTLTATAAGIRFNLRLTPRKPPVINGENGVSQKADGAGQASYYVSFPRLSVEGTLNGAPVTGSAWMDHEWFTAQLADNQVGWDWFSVQLDNGADLMLFRLRRPDGSIDPHSAGTYIDREGRATHLKQSDFSLEPLALWRSPHSHANYPIRWRIQVPAWKLSLESNASLADQELQAEDGIGNTYWEGAVQYKAAGSAGGLAAGVGYLEMTGYSKPVHF